MVDIEELLQNMDALTDSELDSLAKAAEQELQERAYRKEVMDTLGLIPLYRCQEPEHQRYGLYAEDLDHPGLLACGCPKRRAKLVGYE